MTTEAAILDLKRRAEYAAQKANTADKKHKANTYIESVNSIIAFYNRAERLQLEANNLREVIQCLGECLNILPDDLEVLKGIDAVYLRKRLAYGLYNTHSCSSDYFFHCLAWDWGNLRIILGHLDWQRKFTEDLISSGCDEDIVLLSQQMERLYLEELKTL